MSNEQLFTNSCPCKETLHVNMMKFPKPRNLTENSYPDLTEDQPTLLNKLVQAIKPIENSAYDQYIDSTIAFIKSKSKED